MENKIFAGIDEVGRGCLAGPVISCVVVLKKNIKRKFLKDSKTIPFKDRIKIAKHIKQNSWYAIGLASVNEIDKYNIFNATLLSMKRAVKKLKKKPHQFLIDGTHAPKGFPQGLTPSCRINLVHSNACIPTKVAPHTAVNSKNIAHNLRFFS